METIKRTRVESTAEAEAPTASNKDLVKIDTELDRRHEIELALPQAFPDPSADDAPIDQHQGSSHPDSKSPTAVAVDNANAEKTLELPSWDDVPVDHSTAKESSIFSMKII